MRSRLTPPEIPCSRCETQHEVCQICCPRVTMADPEMLMANKVLQDRCSTWVESQKDHSYSEEQSLKRKLEEFEYDDWYNTDSEFDSVSECGGKKRKVGTQLKDEVLNLACEWKTCTFRSNYLDQFLRHVSSHIPSVQISMKDDNEVYVCQWKDCPYNSDASDEIIRHINYHSYHTKLKCIGSNVRGRTKLPVSSDVDSRWRLEYGIKNCIIFIEMSQGPRVEEHHRFSTSTYMQVGGVLEIVHKLSDVLVSCFHTYERLPAW